MAYKKTITTSSSSSKDLWDPSYSVRAYSTYTFNQYVKNGYTYHDIISCSGGWQKTDNSVSTSNRSVLYGASGPKYGNDAYVTQKLTKYPTSDTFSYTAPNAWEPVKTTHSVGVSTSVTLKRGGSTWTLKLSNFNERIKRV